MSPVKKMSSQDAAAARALALAPRVPFVLHGSPLLPMVEVNSYNLELRARGGFIGDRANIGAFFARIDAWRELARERGDDPFGSTVTAELSKKMLARALQRGDSDAANVVQSALDDYATALVEVIVAFRARAWGKVERIVVGGGFRQGRIGELAIARARMILAKAGIDVDVVPILHHPDEAGLIGALYLLPAWVLAANEAMLSVDIGGNNIRCGLVGYRIDRRGRLRKPVVIESALWRHRDDDASRTQVVDELVGMLKRMLLYARRKRIRVAPVVGIGCPGRIEFDGRIVRGTQNLPGNWEGRRFHLPSIVRDRLGFIGTAPPVVIMHNDAVVQGLSEVPRMEDIHRWAVLTIGTGLGNAAFTSRSVSG